MDELVFQPPQHEVLAPKVVSIERLDGKKTLYDARGQTVCVCVCVCVFIKLHITAQPGPDILIFLCYSNRSSLWGISDCYRHDIF